jgi:hypothetical protein
MAAFVTDGETQSKIVSLLKELPKEHLQERIHLLQQYIVIKILENDQSIPEHLLRDLHNTCEVLRLIHTANVEGSIGISHTEFYSDAINQQVDIK